MTLSVQESLRGQERCTIVLCQNCISPKFCDLLSNHFNPNQNQESEVGSIIQATGTVEFENDLWIGNQLKA